MKVGQIVVCNFGVYRPGKGGKHHVDGRMPPEMIKNRLAVVMNSKLGPGCIVVPLSSTYDKDKEARGYHVKVDPAHVPQTKFWQPCDRWAKAELMQYASLERVFTLRGDDGKYVTDTLPRDVVAMIQRAVLTAIGGASLLQPVEPPVQAPEPATAATIEELLQGGEQLAADAAADVKTDDNAM
ncbi:type II toxin-antitoxin system PemK/MazF family toxin [Paraburkholderia jirisanensis]